MKLNYFFLLLLIIIQSCKAQVSNTETVKETFLKEQEELGTPVIKYIGNNFYKLHVLEESEFTSKIDSLQNIFTSHLAKYEDKLDKSTLNEEVMNFTYLFDKYLLEYPQLHYEFTGKKIKTSKANELRVSHNLQKINDIKAYENKYFKNYIKSYLSIQSKKYLENNIYNRKDNQQLLADLNAVDSSFSNQYIKCLWKGEYIYNHIDNLGVKNIDSIYNEFTISCKDNSESVKNISSIYNSHITNRASHTIEIYKKVDGFNLEMHIFQPDSTFKGKRPTIVYFHGGSWSQGKPDWFFETAKQYTEMGWVATAVEYRIKGRHGTYPFDAVKDAKSAIRWLRENSDRLNIDENKILATGNSAGGHLSISTVLVDDWNEPSDNPDISAIPNFVVANAAVYDLTTRSSNWIKEYNQEKNLVNGISPNELTKKTNTKFLLIHGENDRNCPYSTAETFYNKMKALNNDIVLHKISNAEHFIWYGEHSEEVGKITAEYISEQNLN
ncbi:alpha/beta hydrolase [Lacinutrix neustonica]|uniref:Alpha/beta hydrolase n=1 Tax=Lacinutrix neustonica TaxID=2980107 RepID=A0A9E8MY64_9FLAO|nr:alpha/beta hydrolase [Lacinutrix neustonica]WAC03070.1 alpha/beta hydrolase [Lacinutrix neustonica]